MIDQFFQALIFLKPLNLYLPSAVFVAQVLVGPSKQLKQTFQIEHNIVNNPNWPEANQLTIYKHGRGYELWAAEKQIQGVVRAGLEPGTAGLRVRHVDHSTTTRHFYFVSKVTRLHTLNKFMVSFHQLSPHRIYRLKYNNTWSVFHLVINNLTKTLNEKFVPFY